MEAITLDKNAPLPLAEQLAGELLRQIVTGKLKAGARLPTERDFALSLGVARGTVGRAYRRLEDLGAIAVRRGSGSFVQENGNLIEESQKREAAEILFSALTRLRDMGMSDKEIVNLVRLQTKTPESKQKIAVMVLSNNYGILADLENQLSYLTQGSDVNYALSFTTLDSLQGSRNPVELLLGYDLIVATTVDYADTVALAPMYAHKMMEATLVPRTRTMMELGECRREEKISIVYRTPVFLALVERTLYSLGFDPEKIFSTQEAVLAPENLGDKGESVIIGFNEAPMYIRPEYRVKNERFLNSGGRFIRFEYRIDRASLTQIEDRISTLL